ncbi:MAG: glutamine-hydrolyzing carbamoyl-phosphate synthase small subunit [Sphaerochaetaceae bacterium]|jgi:carbamoyl-phosphate synthase small subunit
MQQTTLLLSDGALYTGTPFGYQISDISQAPIAEVVFNTSMSGYQEILTDPSYNGQMVVMTYPHIGNYGCEPLFNESPSIKASAMIVHAIYQGPLPPGRTSLQFFMEQQLICGISGIDTRSLTLHLRERGSQNAILFSHEGVLSNEVLDKALARVRSFPSITERNLIEGVSVNHMVIDPVVEEPCPATPLARFAVMDYGIKKSIIQELYKRDIAVTLLPSTATKAEVLSSGAQALFLSNGPGDPARLQENISMIQSLIGQMPILGICLGHQLITWALGGKTVKMKFGHHGANHPVKDNETGRTFVTSQNHGFMSETQSLPPTVKIWFINANDQSIEGLLDREDKIASVQFHPEASPGPHDATWIFDRFVQIGTGK